MFCQLETLRLCLRSRVRHFVNELPDSLDETYERVLKEIHKTNRADVQRLLQCLAVAIRPLRVDELTAILTFNVDAIEGEVLRLGADWGSEDQEQELLSACPSLITIVDGLFSRVVQFSHFSVKEFLTSDRLATSSEDISRYHILPDAAHTILAQASLEVLLRLDDQVYRSNASSIPLAEYAAEYWISHAHVGSVSSRVMGRMKTLFDSDKPHFAAWVRIHEIDSRLQSLNIAKPLYYSVLCGFYDLVEHLITKFSQHINDCFIGSKHDHPLAAALHGGHIRVAELLFQHGANVDVRGTEGQTPLHRAIELPHNLAIGAVQLLLKHGADVNARRKDLSTPLHLAAAQGYFEIAQMLLERRVDVNSRNFGCETPLHLVAKPTFSRSEANRANLVQLLLKYGTEVNSLDEKDATPLHNASHELDLEVARVLVDHGANVNAVNTWGQTPFHRVFESKSHSKSRFGVAQLLLERGADVDTRDNSHVTLLHLASYKLDLESVRVLLDLGANVNVRNDQGQAPLHQVLLHNYNPESYFGCFGVAQLLVERGADVNARDEHDETPLHLAPYFLELKLVRMLLDHGADVYAENSQEQTPLLRVLESRYHCQELFDVAQLLVEHGADVNTRNKDHETLLHLAPYFLELKSVRILLDHGANVNAEDNRGRTPLCRVLEAENYSDEDRFGVAQVLMERGADVNARYQEHETPLLLASRFPGLKLMRVLLDHGANINVEDKWGRTPLHRVLKAECYPDEDRFSIAQLLLERGANVNARHHETPLHVASHFLELKLVRMLLDHGANVNAEDNLGRTPFHRVLDAKDYSDKGRFGVAQLLMGRGADVNTQDEDHETPLHLASHFLELKLVRMLLDNGANVNAKDNKVKSPLHRALEPKYYFDEGRFGVAQLLVERDADVNARDEDDETPLHLACYFPELNLVPMLLDHGANVHAKDNRGRTPLHRVLEDRYNSDEDRFGVAQLLMERGADVNARDEDDETPLHLASYFSELELARILVDHGANVNAKDNQGQTPLHRVLRAGYYSDEDHFSVAQLLVERGADVNTPDNDHETPLHLASRLVSLEVAWILLKHGADLNVENNEGKTPFQLVRESMREEMERRLPSTFYSIAPIALVAEFQEERRTRANGVALMGLLYGY